MILSELRSQGKEITEEPQLSVSYSNSRDCLSRKALENEEPTMKFEPGLGSTLSPELYANVQRQ